MQRLGVFSGLADQPDIVIEMGFFERVVRTTLLPLGERVTAHPQPPVRKHQRLVELTLAWLEERGALKIEGRMYESSRPRHEALSVFGGII